MFPSRSFRDRDEVDDDDSTSLRNLERLDDESIPSTSNCHVSTRQDVLTMSAVQSQTNGVVAAPMKSSGSSSNNNNEMKREEGLPPNIELSPIPNGGDGSSSSSSLPGPSLPQNTGAHVVHDEEHQSMRGKILDTASTSSSSHEASATPEEHKQTQARQ